MADLLVAGHFFEDIIDGYFPLGESLRQMLSRQGFGAALVVITHAPVLHWPGDDGQGPVPMRLRAATAGLLRWSLALAVLDGNGMRLSGVADWRWPEGERGFGPETRLAEPAFLRGIGLHPGPEDGGAFGRVRRDNASRLGIAGPGVPGWGFTRPVDGIVRDTGAIAAPHRQGGTGPRLSVDLTDPDHARASHAMARDLGL
ncbi:hypothetical protein [Pararhodobacter aggregans]|uniref:Uncharacterized protein n=1 Tax=Pararhodobacter aggregans TaxID=404875 RepID=A0A2T7UKB2_9RHOB|nr:hypothetical protein [Pararhodobacter aggregans]PTX03224.1 hypothetical protein C8N33_10325 [Pararhodobacter aggregans]PVE45097.1 hypothetical protein DDE23_23290 [Pararhodobacter aggregans]